eukprot:CAMPEP_0175488162 /NCGR_PEP_ID=MMETSP0096-20121207/81_1 /TAXON_ID=311494 /ORGANISM="Alexandrium monilatum, Strain CCMP3105" /LENGTH=96 /DNA_ID=CAMNT_0016789999 /DNA_START=4 /DNA_END=291 /DNA_ORIENTATION=+
MASSAVGMIYGASAHQPAGTVGSAVGGMTKQRNTPWAPTGHEAESDPSSDSHTSNMPSAAQGRTGRPKQHSAATTMRELGMAWLGQGTAQRTRGHG